jgi:Protein of unknown function (DUF964).
MEMDDILIRLTEIIKSSQEFTKYKQAKAVISNNPVLKKELEELSKIQGQLSSYRNDNTEAQFRYKYDSLNKIPEVRNYFSALNSLNQLMEKVYANIRINLEKSL